MNCNKYVTDGNVLLYLPGLRWICIIGRSPLDATIGAGIEWDYEGSRRTYFYGNDGNAERLRDEMFNLVTDAIAECETLICSKTYMSFLGKTP